MAFFGPPVQPKVYSGSINNLLIITINTYILTNNAQIIMNICFTVQSSLPFFDSSVPMDIVGGAEIQQYYLGKYLSEKCATINYLSFDYRQKRIHKFEKVTFIRTYSMSEGFSGTRFFYPRLIRIWQALKIADADIYYSRGAGFLPGILCIFCKLHNKKYVFAGAHDTNFIPGELRLRFGRDKLLYEYGLKRADAIIVQSEAQRKLLKTNYELGSIVIKNLYPNELDLKERKSEHILWVATLREWKRPELFVEIAKAFPGEKFIMIGGPGKDGQFYADIKRAAEDIPNLVFKGFLPFEETKKYFDIAKLFINTSIYEGFPNTFLQSWCRGIPVITFFDPDGVVAKNRLGIVVSSTEELFKGVQKMLQSYSDYSESVIQYYRDNHSPKIIDKYIALFQKLLER